MLYRPGQDFFAYNISGLIDVITIFVNFYHLRSILDLQNHSARAAFFECLFGIDFIL